MAAAVARGRSMIRVCIKLIRLVHDFTNGEIIKIILSYKIYGRLLYPVRLVQSCCIESEA